MIGVWLVAKRRADSPRFDMLAGEASLGFGRASHATQNKALALALTAAPGARSWTGSLLLREHFGKIALRGYRL
jgi:hypothetical protein